MYSVDITFPPAMYTVISYYGFGWLLYILAVSIIIWLLIETIGMKVCSRRSLV